MSSTSRVARWVPPALFAVQFIVTAIVMGVLSLVFVVQLTLVPGALFGEYDGILTSVVSWGATGVIEIVAALAVFLVTGVLVGILGLPVRLIPAVRRRWLLNGEVTLAGAVIGVILLIVAYVPLGDWSSVRFANGTYAVYVPSTWPLVIGWLVLALSLSLLVWPARWLPRSARDWWVETQGAPQSAPPS